MAAFRTADPRPARLIDELEWVVSAISGRTDALDSLKRGGRVVRFVSYEADVPAEADPAQADPWVSRPHGHEGGPEGAEGAPRSGEETSHRLSEPPARERSAPAGVETERLRRTKEFRQALANGRHLSCSLFSLRVLARGDDARACPARVGFVCSRRLGNAVARNRARRRLREALRVRSAHLRPGFDVVVVARPAVTLATFQEIGQSYERLLRRAGAWQNAAQA